MTGTKRAFFTTLLTAMLMVGGAALSPAAGPVLRLTVVDLTRVCSSGDIGAAYGAQWVGTSTEGTHVGAAVLSNQVMTITEFDGSRLAFQVTWARKNILEFNITSASGRFSGLTGTATTAFECGGPLGALQLGTLVPVITADIVVNG